MAIQFDVADRTITLHTRATTYQMQIADTGHVLHLYYGPRIDGECLDYLHVLTDCGFSPNCYENRMRREISPDILPLEYSAAGSGDYRVPALECVSAEGVVGADLRYVRHGIVEGKYALPGLPAAFGEGDQAQTLSLVLSDAATGLEVELLYGVFDGADVITRAAVFRNRGDAAIRLDRAASLCLDLPFAPGSSGGEWELLHLHGRHCMERMPERVPLMHGIQTVGSRRGASSHHHNPFTVLMASDTTETQGECLGIMPVYSGNHRTDIELNQADAVRVVSGIGGDLFGWQLDPGDSFCAPEVILCRTDGGMEGLTHHFHDFLNRHLIRSPWKDRVRPLLINSWESMTCDFDADKVLAFAAEAAKLGVELVVLDDGWFGARNDDNAGLGDWTANEAKLPGGLKPLSDAIHAMGLRFGLWIEPEMVNEDSDLYRTHPEWALAVPGRRPVTARNQLVLDMGNREVVEYLYGVFSKLVRENGIDYIKWDMNRNIADTYSTALPPHRQGEVSHRYMLGVYELMDRLTGEYPEVLFENCAGGGGRFDAGMLYYTPQIWCSDDSDAIERLTIQTGTAIGYPVSAMGAHVSACPNQQTGRTTPFGIRAIVAMSGTFGFELDPARLTDDEKRRMRALADRYHRFYNVIHRGRYYRLTGLEGRGGYVAWAFVSPDGGQALVNLVVTRTHANTHGIHLRLRGLDAHGRYRLAEAVVEGCERPDGRILNDAALEGRIFTGRSLMAAGITLRPMRGDYPGVQLLFERVGGDS